MASQTFPVIKGRYVAGRPTKAVGAKLSNHMKYMQYRPRSEQETREDRFLFSQESDHVARKDAVDDVMQHTSRSVNYHSIILSPGEQEHIDDFRQWTRDVMRDLQEQKGVDLHWYAVVHAHERQNTDTPHVHVVLAGAGEDATGRLQTVCMDKADYQFLRAQGRERGNYAFYQELTHTMSELDHEDTILQEQQQRQEERDHLTRTR